MMSKLKILKNSTLNNNLSYYNSLFEVLETKRNVLEFLIDGPNYGLLYNYKRFCKRKELRPKTIDAYEWECLQFLRWFHSSLTDMTVEKVEEFIDMLSDRPKYSTAAKNRTISALSGFMNYLLNREEIIPFNKHTNPANIMRPKKVRRRVGSHTVRPSEVKKTLSRTKKPNTELRKVLFTRDRAMLLTLFRTGVRVDELISLSNKDIDKHYLFVIGKGGHERYTIIAKDAIESLQMHAQTSGIRDDEPFFDMTTGGVRKRLKKLTLGLVQSRKGYLTPHDFRRGFACYAYYQVTNKDIIRVKELLGHVSIKTTELYIKGCTRIVDEYVKNVSSNLNKALKRDGF